MLLQQVSHGAVQFMVYEELRKFVVGFKCKESNKNLGSDAKLLVSLYNQYSSHRSRLITNMNVLVCVCACVCLRSHKSGFIYYFLICKKVWAYILLLMCKND